MKHYCTLPIIFIIIVTAFQKLHDLSIGTTLHIFILFENKLKIKGVYVNLIY